MTTGQLVIVDHAVALLSVAAWSTAGPTAAARRTRSQGQDLERVMRRSSWPRATPDMGHAAARRPSGVVTQREDMMGEVRYRDVPARYCARPGKAGV
jgi:hypothetical protein